MNCARISGAREGINILECEEITLVQVVEA